MKFATEIKDARVLCFAPPMIPGYSISNGFELNLQDKTGGSLDHFMKSLKNFLAGDEATGDSDGLDDI